MRNGLPILDLAAEMEHYNIPNPYGKRVQYCVNHYTCLCQVMENEIIGHWNWDELAAEGDWYEDVIMPAFRSFIPESVRRTEDSDMSVIMDRLCRKFSIVDYFDYPKLTGSVQSESLKVDSTSANCHLHRT